MWHTRKALSLITLRERFAVVYDLKRTSEPPAPVNWDHLSVTVLYSIE
jgi:hypothetical protein